MVVVVVAVYLSICISATLKTKQFCETSSIFEVDNIKNEAILRDFLQKWKVENAVEHAWTGTHARENVRIYARKYVRIDVR